MSDDFPAHRALAGWLEQRPHEVAHVLRLPAEPGSRAPWPDWLPTEAIDQWAAAGIDEPWVHQVQAAEAAYLGNHVALATGTASGKSMAYAMPIVAAVNRSGGSQLSEPCSIYLAPTKALAADQYDAWTKLTLPGVRPAKVDGDANLDERTWARRHANLILTNPDMLHFSILPNHQRWSRILRNLAYLVVDEAHAYRGVFGAHVALVIRRLRRLARHYGSDPTCITASATAAEPGRFGSTLIGSDVVAVDTDSSARSERVVVLWNPWGEDEDVEASALRDAAWLTRTAIQSDCQVLTFSRSRRATEYLASLVRDSLGAEGGEVAAYRGGFLAEERRHLEADLRSGRIRALATTSALELGIDVSGVDAVVTAGWPGTRASLWQQFGRSGRATAPSLCVFVAREDPLDRYIVDHPNALMTTPVEANVIDPSNPRILRPHLCAAAAEVPISEVVSEFPSNAPEVVDDLVADGLLRRRPKGWFWTARERPHDNINLRDSGETVRIVEKGTGRLLGTVDSSSSHRSVHPGAVYVHQGVTHVVDELDIDAAVALVTQQHVDYTTFARDISDIRVLRSLRRWQGRGVVTHWGDVEVASRTVSFDRRATDGTALGSVALDLPERLLTTQAVWWVFDAGSIEGARIDDLAGAVHAAEHAAIGLLPLYATCDRWDIGGVSTTFHPDTGATTIFIYDGVPGGGGFAERGAETAESWLIVTRNVIADCRCIDGCPACIHSPKCGNGNSPLDKAGAVRVLDVILAATVGGETGS